MSSQQNFQLPSDRDSSGRSLGADELALLNEVIESGNLFAIGGTKVPQFERELERLFGVGHARAVSSGSAAVHTALAALDIAPGDEVISSPITDMGAISPILFQGAVPVFADVDPDTLNVTAQTIGERITERTRAVVVTHLFGNPCDMDPIIALARGRSLPVIEDAAQAYLATYGGRLIGTLTEIAAFSMQQTKHMTCGEGGFVITNDDALARRARLWADKGWGYGDESPDHDFLGLNYRMTELQAAVALAQLRKVEAMTAQRVKMADLLREQLADVPGLRPLPTTPGGTQTYWKFVLLVDRERLGVGPDVIGAELKQLGVWNVPRYIRKPAFMCRQFQERRTFADTRFPYSSHPGAPEVERLDEYPGCRDGLAQVLVLPWTERYEEEHVRFIADRIGEAVGRVEAGQPAAGASG
jgi:dTDP-4-amino-4,6-dideoxygalactose transaminase